MNIMLDAAKALDPETAPRSSVMVYVDANDPDCGLGFARFVTKEDRPRIIRLLQAELEAVIRAEALNREGDDELTERVLREALGEEGDAGSRRSHGDVLSSGLRALHSRGARLDLLRSTRRQRRLGLGTWLASAR